MATGTNKKPPRKGEPVVSKKDQCLAGLPRVDAFQHLLSTATDENGKSGRLADTRRKNGVLLPEHAKVISDAFAQVAVELRRLQTTDCLLADFRERWQKLNDRFHEREVLGPMCRGLIQIADRCRQQLVEIRRTLRNCGDHGEPGTKKLLSYLRDVRDADRSEIENLLADCGVEPFEGPGEMFDSSEQRCVDRVVCDDPAQANRIARRVRPGYRRENWIVRVEYVDVYVLKKTSNKRD